MDRKYPKLAIGPLGCPFSQETYFLAHPNRHACSMSSIETSSEFSPHLLNLDKVSSFVVTSQLQSISLLCYVRQSGLLSQSVCYVNLFS